MDEKDQIGHFDDDLQRLLDKYADEFEMSLASQVGTLMCKIYQIIAASHEDDDDDLEVELDDE
jgi:hypothetical protein